MKTIALTHAIISYFFTIAITDLYGANNWEAAISDMFIDSVASGYDAMAQVYYAKGEDAKVFLFLM